jgi:hypothetical protein
LSIEDRDNIIECRCRECYADGALRDITLQPEAKALKVLEADQKRDLYYTATAPTLRADVGDDVRVLAVDLKRETLRPLETIKAALAKGDSPEAIAGLRLALLDTITGDGDLAQLLETPDLKLVRERLMELTSLPPSGERCSKVIKFRCI